MTSSSGRNFEALYTLIPGGANVKEQNSTASNPSRAMSVNVNGLNMNGNTTRIDGAVNYYGWLPYLIAYVPPADSIENVSFTTNDFNAEQGQAGGASIKITTKSGTHDLHGGAWEYYQDASINARPYTDNLCRNSGASQEHLRQFGFNIGGPVYIPKILTGRKKLFFFDNWERTTRRQLISGLQTVPDTQHDRTATSLKLRRWRRFTIRSPMRRGSATSRRPLPAPHSPTPRGISTTLAARASLRNMARRATTSTPFPQAAFRRHRRP